MNAIVLAGESQQSNEQWLKDVGAALTPYFKETTVISYNHWSSERNFNFTEEKAKLEKIIRETNEPYAIIAKSAGSALTIALVREEKAKPVYCVFAGLPLREDETSKYGLETTLKCYNIPTTILQNPNERFIKPKQLRDFLSRLGIIQCQVIPGKGNEHAYTVDEIIETVQLMNTK